MLNFAEQTGSGDLISRTFYLHCDQLPTRPTTFKLNYQSITVSLLFRYTHNRLVFTTPLKYISSIHKRWGVRVLVLCWCNPWFSGQILCILLSVVSAIKSWFLSTRQRYELHCLLAVIEIYWFLFSLTHSISPSFYPPFATGNKHIQYV